MPSTSFVTHVPHAPDCVMDLVVDVERYPSFIPAMSALRKTRDLPNGFEAEAIISYKAIRESFASRVTIDRDRRTILAEKAQRGGTVKSLKNNWTFHELSDGSTFVDFSVDVRLIFPFESLLRQKFDEAKLVIKDVFIQQARENCPLIEADIDVMAEARGLGLGQRLI